MAFQAMIRDLVRIHGQDAHATAHVYLGNRLVAGGPCDSVCGIAWVAQPQAEAFIA